VAVLSDLGERKNIFPLDEVIGISELPFKLSVSLMLEIAFCVQGSPSFDAAVSILAKNSGIKIDPETIREVANNIGRIVFENDKVEAEKTITLFNSGKLQFPEKKKSGVFYIETHGYMLHTREKDERGSQWKENRLGMVFDSDKFISWKNKEGERVFTTGKREYIAYLGDPETFKKHLFALAIRNGYGKYEHTVLIGDGASWVKNMKEEFFQDAQLILDFNHLKGNITNIAKAVFNMDEEKYKPWSEKVVALLKASKTYEAMEEINALGKKRIDKSKFKLLDYINTNKNSIDYARYSGLAYYIGSSAMESDNKTILQERLNRPGMRWKKETGQYLLTLMSKAKSDPSRDAVSGVWERDVEQVVRKKYDIRGFVKKSSK
jgi:hypothetical protein